MFSCDNGLCVAMEDRCNRRADCADQSDERNCRTVAPDDTYLNEYPPLGPEGKIDLVMDLRVNGILDIAEVDGTFRVQFDLDLSWVEPRIK